MRDEKITPLYERLSHDDELQSGNNSISNQKKALEGYARWNGLPNSTRFSNDGVSETCLDLSGGGEGGHGPSVEGVDQRQDFASAFAVF